MARYQFGGVMAAWLVSTVPDEALGEGIEVVTLPTDSTTLEIYDAPDGAGSLVTDLLDENGNPVSEISVPAGDPYIPRFQGPDGVQSLWVQSATGRWLPLPRWDDGAGDGGGDDDGEQYVKLEGGNEHEYEDSQSPPWLIIRRPNDSTDSTQWSNMVEFHFWDSTTNQYRLGFYLNEKGLLRTRGVTPTDVPVRFMAHPNQGSNTAVVEVTPSDNTIKLIQLFLSQAVFRIPVVVPYLVNPLGERLYFGTADPATDPAYEDHRPDIGSGWIDFLGEGA